MANPAQKDEGGLGACQGAFAMSAAAASSEAGDKDSALAAPEAGAASQRPLTTLKAAKTEATAKAAKAAKPAKTTRASKSRSGRVKALRSSTCHHLKALVEEAVESVRERRAARPDAAFSLEPVSPVRIVFAFSGGRDSTALLDIVSRIFHAPGQTSIAALTVVHVHHGLSPNADSWVEHAREFCKERRLPLVVERVYVNPHAAEGIEAAARQARYRVLLRVARKEGANIIMTAHHQDDRIETFLIQWLRGAGPEGLAAMSPVRTLESVQGPLPIVLVRPWLTVSGEEIARYARQAQLDWVEDESNTDTRFLRNLIRQELLPHLDKARPGWRAAAARSVSLVAQASQLISSIGEEDLAYCAGSNPAAINISRLLKLSVQRQAMCVRAWLSHAGIKAPSKARLDEMLRQIRQTHGTSRMCFLVGGKEVRRWGENLVLVNVPAPVRAVDALQMTLDWRGEPELSLGLWGGVLRFEPCDANEDGIDGRRLREGRLEVRPRKGGEKIKLHRLRPSRNLKQLYQAAKIPAFERSRLPLVWLDGSLIFAAGLGADVRKFADRELVAERVRLVWVPDEPLIAG